MFDIYFCKVLAEQQFMNPAVLTRFVSKKFLNIFSNSQFFNKEGTCTVSHKVNEPVVDRHDMFLERRARTLMLRKTAVRLCVCVCWSVRSEMANRGQQRQYQYSSCVLQELGQQLGDDKSLSEHLKLPVQRINDYQLLLRVSTTTFFLPSQHFLKCICLRPFFLQLFKKNQHIKFNYC